MYVEKRQIKRDGVHSSGIRCLIPPSTKSEVLMKATFACMQKLRHVRGNPSLVEQPKVSVPLPTGPRAKKSFLLVSSRDPEIYPLIFCVSVGLAIGAFSLVRHMTLNPDVNLSRHRRETPAWKRYKADEGETFSQNRHHLVNLKPNPINTFSESLPLQKGTDEPFTKHL